MMNCKRISVLALAFVGALLCASVANAGPAKVFLGVGSSAQFPTAGIAAVSPDPVNAGLSAVCGTHLWTGKNGKNGGVIEGVDPRSVAGTPPLEPGNIWVAWDAEPATVVCAYLSVDSVVGLRLYFSQGAGGDWATAPVGCPTSGNGTLHFTAGTVGGSLITGFPDTDATVPADVVAAINSGGGACPVGFTVAMTDIRPEDGQYAYGRAAVSNANGGFNYNPLGATCGPNPVLSSFSATNAQVCAFAISSATVAGTDPVSHLPIPVAQTYTFGAAPVIIFGNNNGNLGTGTLAGSAPCASPYPTNILSKTAAKLWSGQIGLSQQVFGSGVCLTQLLVNQREPVSGTYNTFEFQVVHARDGNSGDTQEINGALNTPINGNPPAGGCYAPPAAFPALPGSCTNPLFLSSGQNSVRLRAIGTGEMVNDCNGTAISANQAYPYPDKLCYAFYSLGSFASTTNTGANVVLRYFTLQGVDALYSNYNTAGAFPICVGSIKLGTFNCNLPLPTFAHLIDGSYRTWSNYRWVAPPGLAAADIRLEVLQAGQDQAHFALVTNPGANGGGTTCNGTGLASYAGPCFIGAIADFVAASDFPVFRSHYPLSVIPIDANNGTTSAVTGFCAADQVAPNCVEEGGDMAGVGFFKVTDIQYFNATGGEFLTNIE